MRIRVMHKAALTTWLRAFVAGLGTYLARSKRSSRAAAVEASMKPVAVAFLIGLASLAPARAAVDDAADAAKADLGKLQGEWAMVSGVADGFAIPDAMLPNSKRVCKGDEITATVGGQLVMRAKITIDVSKTPKTVEYQVIEGPTKGKQHLGIYEFDGETFKSCFGAPGAERPTDFTSKQGDRRTFSVWKRQPDKAATGKSGQK